MSRSVKILGTDCTSKCTSLRCNTRTTEESTTVMHMVSYQMPRSEKYFGKIRVQTDVRRNNFLVSCVFLTTLPAIKKKEETLLYVQGSGQVIYITFNDTDIISDILLILFY
jgi:hypothetical protein